MESSNSSHELITPIERFVWDLTYACPLRCVHCYSESGRRPASMLDRDDMLKVVEVIIRARPQRISFGGGEPLLAPWWAEAARLLCAANVPVTLFTSGWMMDDDTARELATSVTGVVISIDGASPETHDVIRGRRGSFQNAMVTLEILDRFKRERTARGEPCYTLGIDFTVTRSNQNDTQPFVRDMTSRFTALDFIRFGAVVPEGLAQEEDFVDRELLRDEELIALGASQAQLASLSKNGADISVTDSRYFLFEDSPMGIDGATMIAHIEPDGQLRASTNYEAKVGNVLNEPLEELWRRALDWRKDPFVVEQMTSIRSLQDWAKATRALDRRYGSEADKVRIARRSNPLLATAPQ